MWQGERGFESRLATPSDRMIAGQPLRAYSEIKLIGEDMSIKELIMVIDDEDFDPNGILDSIDNDNRWDTGELGQDEKFAQPVKLTPEQEKSIDDSLDLQTISIRLPKDLFEGFKDLSESKGIKYRALMCHALRQYLLKEMSRE